MKKFWSLYIGDLFFRPRCYMLLIIGSTLFLFRYFLNWLGDIPFLFAGIILVMFIIDYLLLFTRRNMFFARRALAERLSNGDLNSLSIYLESKYNFPTDVNVVDEIPHQFQKRDVLFRLKMNAGAHERLQYNLRPVKRGEYEFGRINVYVSTVLGLIQRRFKQGEAMTVPVYPSYLQMRKYQLMAISNRLSEVGVKKIRRIGHSMEFEQIKEYVRGDDYRQRYEHVDLRRRGQHLDGHGPQHHQHRVGSEHRLQYDRLGAHHLADQRRRLVDHQRKH